MCFYWLCVHSIAVTFSSVLHTSATQFNIKLCWNEGFPFVTISLVGALYVNQYWDIIQIEMMLVLNFYLKMMGHSVLSDCPVVFDVYIFLKTVWKEILIVHKAFPILKKKNWSYLHIVIQNYCVHTFLVKINMKYLCKLAWLVLLLAS